MNIKAIQGSTFNLDYFNNNQKMKQNIDEEINIDVNKEVIDYRKLSNEEAKSLYYAYQGTNLMKSKIEIYMDVNEENSDSKEFYDLKKSQNRIETLEYYRNEVRLQDNDSKYEIWA